MSQITEKLIPPLFDQCYAFHEAEEARKEGLYPFFIPIDEYRGSKVVIQGRELLMAGSNNYLGLSLDPRVKKRAQEAIDTYGTSCSGSRFMNGTLNLHEKLEKRLADFVGKESALCFTTGYQTNLGVISALLAKGSHVISDKYNHASIMDGIFLSRGLQKEVQLHRYHHNNLEDLEKILAAIPREAPKLVVTDGVFSMEGDIAPLPGMRRLCDQYRAVLYLDEAHALGVLGETGRGTMEYYGDFGLADLVMSTFSKSFGSLGGFVAGDEQIIDYIRHHSRPLIFTASMPPANIAAVQASLDIIEQEPERIHRLGEIAKKMIKGFKDCGFNVGPSETAIVPLIIGDTTKTFMFWKALFEEGVYVNPVISPAVPPNRSLIRTSYMALHTDEELEYFLDLAAREAAKLGIIT